MVIRVWPSTTVSVSLTEMELTVPAHGATTGFSGFDDSHFLVGFNLVANLDLQLEHGTGERALHFGATGSGGSCSRSGSGGSGNRSSGSCGNGGIKNFNFDVVGLAFETDTDCFLHFDFSWL